MKRKRKKQDQEELINESPFAPKLLEIKKNCIFSTLFSNILENNRKYEKKKNENVFE